MYSALFIAAQIGLLASVLCATVELSEFYVSYPHSLVGKELKAITREGPSFSITLGPAGEATLIEFRADQDFSQSSRLGRWYHFPEGIVIKWAGKLLPGECKSSNLGLISASEHSVMYEGYAERFSEPAEVIAQMVLESRSDT